MPNWAIHLLVPLLVLMIVGKKEEYKYILLLLPFAVFPFIDASLEISKANELLWIFDYGFSGYRDGWKVAHGYISDSVGTGSLALVFVAGVWAARYRLLAWRNK
jgi:hypothetical protein